MKKLYISDLDGTLLGTDSKVSDKSARIISELSRRGVAITVATARTPATVDVLLNDVETDIPAIVMTGAALWDRKTHRYIAPVLLPTDVSARAVEAFGAEGVNPFVYILGNTGKLEVCTPRRSTAARKPSTNPAVDSPASVSSSMTATSALPLLPPRRY